VTGKSPSSFTNGWGKRIVLGVGGMEKVLKRKFHFFKELELTRHRRGKSLQGLGSDPSPHQSPIRHRRKKELGKLWQGESAGGIFFGDRAGSDWLVGRRVN